MLHYPYSEALWGGRGVIELLDFFINHFFVGAFKYDFGPPTYALELRDYVKYMFSLSMINININNEWNQHELEIDIFSDAKKWFNIVLDILDI